MARLGDVCTVVSGTTPKSNHSGYWDGNLNWVTPAELTDESDTIYETQRKITLGKWQLQGRKCIAIRALKI